LFLVYLKNSYYLATPMN